MKRTTTRTGKSPSRRRAPLVLLLLCGLLAASLAPVLEAGKKKEKKLSPVAAAEAFPAILAGTVFAGAGFAFPGAEVLIAPADNPAGKDRWKTVSDARGEFFQRLPKGPATYNVVVRATGMKTQEKQVAFTAGERQEQNFLLESATEGKKK